MDKNLPRVYANPIDKQVINNQEYHVSRREEVRNIRQENIPKKINEIFSNPHHVYKSRVSLVVDQKEFETTIVGRTNDYLLTLQGDKINIHNISYIERI